MTQLIHMTGNIFDTKSLGIGHGVNVDGVMGHGIAVQFRNRFPIMHEAYVLVCKQNSLEPGQTMIWPIQLAGGKFQGYIFNIASQDRPGRNARMEWLRQGVKASLEHAEQAGMSSIALPRIGSGIGGLDAAEVEKLLTSLAAQSPVDIELWTLPAKD